MIAELAKVSLPLQANTFVTALLHFFNETTVQQIEQVYGTNATTDYDTLASVVLRDYFFVCATRRLLFALNNMQTTTYTYRFAYRNDNPLYPIFGDTHASELRYVFANPFYQPWSSDDQAMADQFGVYWTNLAKAASPNSESALNWPPFVSGSETNIVLDVPSTLQDNLATQVCQFWDTVQIDPQ